MTSIPFVRTHALAVLAACACAVEAVAQTGGAVAPHAELERAVQRSLEALKPHQRSLVAGTSRENLPMLLPEWGSDIQEMLGLAATGAAGVALAQRLCGRPCTADEAALRIMEAVQERLAAPRPNPAP